MNAPTTPLGVDPVSSVPTEHASAQRRSGGSGPGPGLLPGSEGPADRRLWPRWGAAGRGRGPGQEVVVGEGGGGRRLVARRSGRAALPPLWKLLPAPLLLAVLLVLLPGAGLRLTNECADFNTSFFVKAIYLNEHVTC